VLPHRGSLSWSPQVIIASSINNMEFEGEVMARERGGESLGLYCRGVQWTTLRVNARHVAGTPVIAQMGFNTKGFQPNLKPEYQSTVHYSKQKRNKFHPCFFYFACVPILIFVSVRRILNYFLNSLSRSRFVTPWI